MPEGDTIHHAANRIRPVLAGRVPDQILTPQPRHARDRWPERLEGRAVLDVRPRGKHLLLHFEGGLTLHSHLRMSGAWDVYASGQRWRRPSRRAWLIVRADDTEVVQFDGPVLDLMTDMRTRNDARLTALGPDILADELDLDRVIRRLREDDPTRPIGDALIDQRTLAGIGNLWKAEACWAATVDPWRSTSEVSDDEVLAIVGFARERMLQSSRDGYEARPRAVYGRSGAKCQRCGGRIRARGQWEDNRTTFWCPGCQR